MRDKLLFDSSAIINIVAEGRTGDLLLENFTIDLATYKIGNVIWKQVFILAASLQKRP
ncbi:MAG: hypothetical protein QW304_09370 [Thermoproteota archaeon]|nr:hypothetical protein [Candidatus Bathyarchaeota archaeon]